MLTVTCMLGLPALAQVKGADKDLKALQGTWQCVSSETEGEARSFEVVQRLQLMIAEKQMIWYDGGKVLVKAEILAIDSSKSPPELTFQFTYPDEPKDKKTPSIYSLIGNILITCGHVDGRRPTEFSSTSEKGALHLDVWRKMNKKDQ